MPSISCVICAYNEAGRIDKVLSIVTDHPLISEIIVVNDGSTDSTESIVAAYPDVVCITLPQNKGKSFAMAQGIERAKGALIILLDADLTHITAQNITDLILPVLESRADVSLSLRGNSLGVYRMIGLDFVSGERVLPRSLLRDSLQLMKELPRFGVETFMDGLIVKKKMRVAVVDWPNVIIIRKSEKIGQIKGWIAEMKMLKDVLKTASFWSLVRLNVQMLRLRISTNASLNDSAEAAQE